MSSVSSGESDAELDLPGVSGPRTKKKRRRITKANKGGVKKKKVETNWSAQTTDVKPEHKFMCDKVGESHELPVDASPFDYLSLLLPETFFQSVANKTISYADLKQEIKGVPDMNWTKVTEDEIKLFVCIQYMFGIHHMPDTSMY